MTKSPRCIHSIIVEKLRLQAVLSMKRTRVETIRTQSRLKTAKRMDDVCSDGTPVVKSMNSFTPTIKQPINRFVKESGSVESPLTQHDIERSNSTTVSTMTTADFNDVLQQNSNLKRDIEFQMYRTKLKMAHIKHVRQAMNHEIKDVLRIFHTSNKFPLKKYDNWKEGLDAVFRLNRAVILKTRKGDEVLITSSQGMGGYGRVAKGYHMQLNWEKVVIKEYIGFEEQNNKLQFYGELKTLTDLCSNKYGDAVPREFIPHYIDRKDENGSYFLMSAWAGNDISRLDAYQRNHLLGHIGSSLVIILRAIHKKRFLHRDVKPENICVDEIDTVRLIDVGSMVRTDESGQATTDQPYNDYQHCSLNMHKAYGKQRRCVMSIFDDLWMVIFTLLRVLNMVPRYWNDQRRREDIIADKKRIIFDPDNSFKGSSNTLTNMKRAICYIRDSNQQTFDYDYLAKLLSQL